MTQRLEDLKTALADRYEIEREIGQGGMANVYLARDLRHDREVAVKVLRPDLAAALGPERFLREIKIAANLTHPHILPLHDSGEAEGFLYYVMPYIKGDTLRQRIEKEGALPVAEAVRLVREVVDALAFAHAQGVVHRDIKPDNVMLSGHHAMVTDFGVAKAVSEASSRNQLTTAGVALGTPAYMAPEQATADPHVDHRADIYAVGALAYELLTGRTPFTGATPQAILAAHVTEQVEPVSKHRDHVSAELDAVVMKCLEKQPADRWQSADEFLPHLEALSTPSGGITPTDTRPLAGVAAAGNPVRKRLIGGGLVVVAAVIGGLMMRGGGEASDELNPNLLAIAPFDVIAGNGRLDYWREGISDIVSRQLDDLGPLTTVSTTVAVSRWRGRGDPAGAVALGQATGAGLVVFGTVVESGADSVRVQVTLYDVENDESVAEIQLRESSDRIDALADSLSLRLADGLARIRELGAMRLQNIGSTSPAAVKAFLRGEALFRRADWDSAIVQYEEAIREDSSFALGWWRLATAQGWSSDFPDNSEARRRAASLNHGLPRRDSLLIVVDSLFTSIGTADSLWESNVERYWRTVERAVREYPQDPGSWYRLGEAYMHHASAAGRGPDSAYIAMDRALELDSTMAEPLIHAMQGAMYRDGGSDASRYVNAFLAIDPTGHRKQSQEVKLAILDSGLAGDALMARLAQLPAAALQDLGFDLARWPGSEDAVLAVSGEFARRFPGRGGIWDLMARSFRGHLEESSRLGTDLLGGSLDPLTEALAEYATFQAETMGGVSTDSVLTIIDGWLGDPTRTSRDQSSIALPWLAHAGDTLRILRYRETLEIRMRDWTDSVMARPGLIWRIRLAPKAVDAYLSVARGDTAAAIRALQEMPRHPSEALYRMDELMLARLLVGQGRDSEAVAILELGGMVVGNHYLPLPDQILWILERGRIHGRLGNREQALRDYSYVMNIWQNADEVLQPLVAEAREAVVELSGEN